MKSGTCVALLLAGAFFLSSCYHQDDHYSGAGNGNYNNNNGNTGSGGYPYVFDEEFNGGDHYGWTFTDAADSAYASITSGSYQYVDYSAVLSNLAVVNTGANTGGNFTVTTRIKSNKVMGLIFGASGTDNGYAFFIDTAGNYSLYREGYGGAASTVIIPFTQDSANALKNNWNVLEIDQVSNTWTGFINGAQVFSFAAPSLAGAQFGFKVLPGTIGYADYLMVKSY